MAVLSVVSVKRSIRSTYIPNFECLVPAVPELFADALAGSCSCSSSILASTGRWGREGEKERPGWRRGNVSEVVLPDAEDGNAAGRQQQLVVDAAACEAVDDAFGGRLESRASWITCSSIVGRRL